MIKRFLPLSSILVLVVALVTACSVVRPPLPPSDSPASASRGTLPVADSTSSEALEREVNYCNVMLDMEAFMVYHADGLEKILNGRACPQGVTLDETLKYVNRLLGDAFKDPYTSVLSPQDAKRMREQTAGTAKAFGGGGIGLMLSFDWTRKLPSHTAEKPSIAFTGLVYHVVSGSPAAKAGVEDGDYITTANGVDLIGLDTDHVVNDILRGPVGSELTVTIKRGKSKFSRTLVREEIGSDDVWSRHLGHGIYAIIITHFREGTAYRLYQEVKKLSSRARALALDLRNNDGGVFEEAVLSAAWFIRDGVIVSQRQRVQGDPFQPWFMVSKVFRQGENVYIQDVNEVTGEVLGEGQIQLTLDVVDSATGEPSQMVTTKIPFVGGMPIAVIGNGLSASAAEIFIGALDENYVSGDQHARTPEELPQGGTFIGVKSFGKFVGQTLVPGPLETLIKATTFRYFTPRGEWFGDEGNRGLTPRIVVKQPDNAMPYTATDRQLGAALKWVKNALRQRR